WATPSIRSPVRSKPKQEPAHGSKRRRLSVRRWRARRKSVIFQMRRCPPLNPDLRGNGLPRPSARPHVFQLSAAHPTAPPPPPTRHTSASTMNASAASAAPAFGRHETPALARTLRRENDRPKLRRGMACVCFNEFVLRAAIGRTPGPYPSY